MIEPAGCRRSQEYERANMPHTITNKALTLTVDELGRIVSLKKHATGVELITYPDIAETFRLVIPTGRHTLAFVYGSKQAPPRIDAAGQIVTIYYDGLEVEGQLEPIRMTLMLTLVGNTTEIQARARIENGGNRPIDCMIYTTANLSLSIRIRASNRRSSRVKKTAWHLHAKPFFFYAVSDPTS